MRPHRGITVAGIVHDQRAALEQALSAAAKRLRDPEFDRNGLLWDGDQPRAFTSASARGLWALTASAL
ncbi:hypothetical protein FBQ85_03205, partial [Cytophagia bacterium CHB2]|nr:hypothetical protein [Cytophagia bacterium CHB2]